jgi:hypothetical protein
MFNIILKLDNFLGAQDCNHLIEHFKNNIDKTSPFGDRIILKYKNETILEKLNSMMTFFNFKNIDNMEIVKWPEGSALPPHHDDGDFLTFIIFLNEDFDGGESVIENIKIKPKLGDLLIFSNGLYLHEIKKIKKGERFVLIAWYK